MSKISQVKQHVKDHKEAYVAGGVCLAVGLAGGIVLTRSSSLVTIRPIQALTWKSTQTIEVFIEALGDPGNIIQDTTTGIVYASQNQAARELGLSAARISEQLAGKRITVNGHVFEKLGKAMVAG